MYLERDVVHWKGSGALGGMLQGSICQMQQWKPAIMKCYIKHGIVRGVVLILWQKYTNQINYKIGKEFVFSKKNLA